MKRVPIKLQWADYKMARRPTSGQYITVAKFYGKEEMLENQDWSIVIKFDPSADASSNTCTGTAEFLFEEGPSEVLQSGTYFDLLEGNRVSARVYVL